MYIQQESFSNSSKRFIENSVVECKASENVCEKLVHHFHSDKSVSPELCIKAACYQGDRLCIRSVTKCFTPITSFNIHVHYDIDTLFLLPLASRLHMSVEQPTLNKYETNIQTNKSVTTDACGCGATVTRRSTTQLISNTRCSAHALSR